MAFMAGNDILGQLLDALGLQGVRHVKGLTISVLPEDVVTVTVVKYPSGEELGVAARLLTNSGGGLIVNEVEVPAPRRDTVIGCCERNANRMACDCYHQEA